MRRLVLIIIVLITGALLVGCGSTTTQTDQQQIRTVATQYFDKLLSDTPTSACVYSDKPNKCLGAVVLLQGMKVNTKDWVAKDWKEQVQNHPILISGNKATMTPLSSSTSGKLLEFTKINGHWLFMIEEN